MFDLDEREMIIRLLAALIAGSLIGIDREVRNRSAGLRTHALAAEGAALFTMAAILATVEADKAGFGPADPTRIMSTIVQGIGFLAAGVIFSHQAKVRGLTTAAGLWVTAAIGMLCGAGFYFLAIAATLSTILVLAVVKVLEKRFAVGPESD
ncbi:MAG: MgtC/SapB family protein [Thermomicrobiales bacterium]|jgi:putative Mg2+ transporter-C (MgtC) family protein|nr:MgtC/SapB family protein [Thermomicrobiales bacterium]MCC6943384.1 MgtC/SapB family protein [Thermomicrobiales bacterium]